MSPALSGCPVSKVFRSEENTTTELELEIRLQFCGGTRRLFLRSTRISLSDCRSIAFRVDEVALPAPVVIAAPPISQEEADATMAALKPPKRRRPLIAIIGINATKTTDYLMPYGILRRADVADVVALGTKPGPVTHFPALMPFAGRGTIRSCHEGLDLSCTA